MRSEAAKYHSYAMECERQAKAAEIGDLRRRLEALAQVWKDAARIEEAISGSNREASRATR